jgi:hypothetical protein
MTRTIRLTMSVLMLLAASAPGFSQDDKAAAPEQKFYHLDFVVKELEGGKVTNARNYSMNIATGKGAQGSSIRSGGKVPVQSGTLPIGDKTNVQFTYVDVGVNIDCRAAKELPDHLAMIVVSDVNSALHSSDHAMPPVIRKTQWSSEVLIPLRKPTTIFSSDDAGTKIQMQLEVTATPLR